MMKNHFSAKTAAIICTLIAGIMLLLSLRSTAIFSNNPFLFNTICSYTNKNIGEKNTNDVANQVDNDEVLSSALEKAAMNDEMINKTVVIAVVDRAYAEGEMLDLFLESFWIGGNETRRLARHILIVAVDGIAYERCIFRGLKCYRLGGDEMNNGNSESEKVFMSKEFVEMMWRRTLFLIRVLRLGYSFVFTDTDVMWLRNPFKLLSTNETEMYDLQISTDKFNGDPSSEWNPINTGFYHVRSNGRTIALFERWYGLKNNSRGHKEQDILQDLICDGALRELNVTARFLDTKWFSGFCQDSHDPLSVVTIHANCCRYISAKVADLKRMFTDFMWFREFTTNQTLSTMQWSPHTNCSDSWRH